MLFAVLETRYWRHAHRACPVCHARADALGAVFFSRARLLWSRDYSNTTKRTVRFVLSFVNHGENAQDGETCLAWLPARCCLVFAALASCSLNGEKKCPPSLLLVWSRRRFCVQNASLILLGVSFVMGRHFDALIASGEIVGAGEDEDRG